MLEDYELEKWNLRFEGMDISRLQASSTSNSGATEDGWMSSSMICCPLVCLFDGLFKRQLPHITDSPPFELLSARQTYSQHVNGVVFDFFTPIESRSKTADSPPIKLTSARKAFESLFSLFSEW